jgi:hypothetical protein
MRKILYLMTVMAGLSCGAFGDARIFTDSQGRAIEAELLQFEESSQTVTIKRKGSRQSMRVQLNIFSKKDQDYILEWGRLQALHDSRFEAVISKSSDKDGRLTSGTGASTDTYTDHQFNIRFENGTKNNLEDLTLEYVIFYEQEHYTDRASQKTEMKDGAFYKKEKISLPAREDVEFSTDTIKLREWKTYYQAAISSDIHGIRIRLTMTLDSGQTTVREFCYPSGLKQTWVTESVSAMARTK